MTLKTAIGSSNADHVYVRGLDLCDDIIGRFDFVEMMWFTIHGQRPAPAVHRMLNVILVTLADHGLTPSAIAARLTIHGAPEALQGAVAAGLLGAGNRLLGTMQITAQMLTDELGSVAFAEGGEGDAQADAWADALIARYKAERRIVPGFGHPIHVNGDPRIPVLARLSRENGFHGRGWRALEAIERRLQQARNGRLLPLNAAGAIGGIAHDMGLQPAVARGLSIVARAAGLVAHLIEDQQAPLGQQIWDLVLAQDDTLQHLDIKQA